MRYAVFSDIHSNLEAFDAILDTIARSRIDKNLFLGDIVGYGASPGECIARLRALDALSVAGNHDGAVVAMTPIEYFHEEAYQAVLWTQEHISEADRVFLRGLPLTREVASFCLVHGTLQRPQDFDYMIDSDRAGKTLALCRQKVCFVGHTHAPGVFEATGEKIVYSEGARFEFKEGRRYIVNDGSVGQPRDGDPRACFCIFDDAALTLEFRRVPYDVAAAQKKIREAGCAPYLADRLSVGR
jgi:diadenosine tetraphosphatase ApaH/serine/threonine PP2A family protein phosphatase